MTCDNHLATVLQKNSLRAFVRRNLIFLLPIVILGTPPAIILAWSGESFCDLEEVISQLNSRPTLIGFSYNEQNYGYLKHRRLTTLPRQSVVALGSSRVLAFRKEMFVSSFYNAGYTVSPITEFREFLTVVPTSHHPDILLIGLDQWMFNTEWLSRPTSRTSSDWTENTSQSLQKGFKSIRKLYKDVVRGKVRPAQLNAEASITCVGLNAVCNRIGFRNDGSFSYGNHVTKLLQAGSTGEDFQFPQIRRFVGADRVDSQAVEEVRELLNYCAENGIYVIAFVPPLMDALYDQMEQSGEHGYLAQIGDEVRPLFLEHGFEYYEFQSMASCGSDDTEAIDSFHGSDVTYLKMLLRMLDQRSRLNEFTDRQQLVDDLDDRRSRYCVYAD